MARAPDASELAPLFEVAARQDLPSSTRARALNVALRFQRSRDRDDVVAGLLAELLAADLPEREGEDLIEVTGALPTSVVSTGLEAAARRGPGRIRVRAAAELARRGFQEAIDQLLETAVKEASTEVLGNLAAIQNLADPDAVLVELRDVAWDDPLIASFWLAVLDARAGRPTALLAYVTGEREPPPFLWGSPGIGYAALASVRPLPEAVVRAILEAAGIDDPTDPEQARSGGLLVWGLTGIADAEGFVAAGPPPPEPPAPAPRTEEMVVQAPRRTGIPPILRKRRGSRASGGAGDADVVAPDPGDADPLEGLLRRVEMVESAGMEAVELGNAVISEAGGLPERADPSVGPRLRRAARRGGLDAGQLAHLAVRFGDVGAIIREGAASPLEGPDYDFLVAVAEEAGGLAQSPYRGSGPGGGEAAPREVPRMVSGSEATDAVRRTPHMDLSNEGALAPDEHLTVRVFADTGPARPEEASTEIVIEAPVEQQVLEVEVSLILSAHLAHAGPSRDVLQIQRTKARSSTVSFQVRVRSADEIAAALQEGASHHAGIIARFSYGRRPSGAVSRTVPLNLTDTSSPADDDPPPPDLSSLAVDTTAEPNDLTVTVSHLREDPPDRFVCEVSSPHVDLALEPEPWHIGGARERVNKFIERFIAADPKRRVDELVGAGWEFFEATPEAFQSYFWALYDGYRDVFRTIHVVSVDTTVPWEMMVPLRDDPGDDDPTLPLGVTFEMGRWTKETLESSPQRIRIDTGVVVAPRYDSNNLDWAPEEAASVCARFAGEIVDPATGDHLAGVLQDHVGGLFHFVGHGYVDGAFQELGLDGKERIGETVLRRWLRSSGFLRRKESLVVLNACEVGRLHPAMVGAGGVSQAFIREGAAAVVAPIWSVKDSVAREVAEMLYDALEDDSDVPLARVMSAIRRRSYVEDEQPAEDSYAAYCFYGDPRARVEVVRS